MEHTERSETSAYKIQTPGNYPEESIQRPEHGEGLKSRKYKSQVKKASNNKNTSQYRITDTTNSSLCATHTEFRCMKRVKINFRDKCEI
jgi:hypothetical protein